MAKKQIHAYHCELIKMLLVHYITDSVVEKHSLGDLSNAQREQLARKCCIGEETMRVFFVRGKKASYSGSFMDSSIFIPINENYPFLGYKDWAGFVAKEDNEVLYTVNVEHFYKLNIADRNKIIDAVDKRMAEIIAIKNQKISFPIIAPTPDALMQHKHLLGRSKELEELKKRFIQEERHKVVLINGIGGIGKTTLANAFCATEPYKSYFDHHLWLAVSETAQSLLEPLVAVLRSKIDLDGKDEAEQQHLIGEYLRAVRGRNLLVFDNITNEVAYLKSKIWLRTLTNWQSLFTSRVVLADVVKIVVEALSSEDAKTAFCQYAYAQNADSVAPELLTQIDILLQNIAYHTLLIEFCGKSVCEDVTTLQNLIDMTAEGGFTADFLELAKVTTEHQSNKDGETVRVLPKAYILQIFSTETLSDFEQTLLRYISVLPSQLLPIEKLLPLFSIELNSVKYNQALNALSNLSKKGWLRESEKGVYYCHPLLQLVAREKLEPNEENCVAMLEGVIEKTNYYPGVNRTQQVYLIPILISLTHYIIKDTEVVAHLYNNTAFIYKEIGQNKDALDYDTKALSIREKILDKNHLSLAASYNNIAITYENLGYNNIALDYNIKALVIRENELNENHPDLTISYNNIAAIYRNLAKYNLSLSYALKSLAIREKTLKHDHPSLGIIYNNVAAIYRDCEQYDKAIEYGLKAIDIFETAFDEDHPYLTNAYNNISGTYQKTGQNDVALSYDMKSLSIRKKNIR